MQTSRPPRLVFRLDHKALITAVRYANRYKKHPEAIESVIAAVQERGARDSDIATIRMLLVASREAALDHESSYRVDQYLTAGVGALDLVLLPTVLPMGTADRALFIALLSLSISLVFVSWSLVVGFVKRDAGIVVYGGIHSTLVALSLLSGATALTATFWHFSVEIGATFLILTIVAFIACVAYSYLVRTAVGFLRQQQAATTPSEQEHQKQEEADSRATAHGSSVSHDEGNR